MDESYRRAYEILKSQEEILDHLSRDLFEKETMTAEEMQEIFGEHRDGPKIAPGTAAIPGRGEEELAADPGDAEVAREAAE